MEVQHEEVVRAFLDAVGAEEVAIERGGESLGLTGLVGGLPIRVLVLGDMGSEMPMPVVRGSASWGGVLRPWAIRVDVGESDGPADALAALRRGTTLWQARVGPSGRSAVLLTTPPFDVLSRRDVEAFRHWGAALASPEAAEARRAVSRVALRASGSSPARRPFGAASLHLLSALGPWREPRGTALPSGPVGEALLRSGLFEHLEGGPRRRAGPFLAGRAIVGRSERHGLRIVADVTELRLPSSMASEARLLPRRWTTVRLGSDRPHVLETLASLAAASDERFLWWWLTDDEADAPLLRSALVEIGSHLGAGRDGPYR